MDGELAKTAFDLIVLDILMPGEDGFSICRRLQESTRIPIILLSALVEETDKIVGLELGADDYVTKPFIPRELLARIKSVIRRSTMLPPRQRQTMGIVQFEGWNFNFSQKEVIGEDGVIVRLSSSEHILLISFIEHAGVTLSRD
jgi:two-component system OmpR family response regulator